MESKFQVKMTSFAYSILLAHLVQRNLILISSMINEKVQIDQSESTALHQLGLDRVKLLEYTPSLTELPVLALGVPGRPGRLQTPDTLRDLFYGELLLKVVEPLKHARKAPSMRPSAPPADPLEPSIVLATINNTYGDMNCMHVNSEVQQTAAGFRDGLVRVWRLGDREGFGTVPSTMSDVAPLSRPQWPDGRRILPRTEEPKSMLELIGHSAPVYGVSQDEQNPRFVLSASADKSVRLWEMETAQTVAKYCLLSPVWGVDMGPLGYYFATGTQDGSVSMFSVDRSQPCRLMLGHIGDVSAVQWHPNCSLLLSGSDDRTCRLWDIRSGKCVRLLAGCPSSVASVAVSSAGGAAAAGCENGSICVWDLGSARMHFVLNGHSSYVNSIGFNDNDAALVSGSSDCSINVWDINREVSAHGPLLLEPHKSFATKYTPVMHVGFTSLNLIYAGGPFDVASAPGKPQ